MGSIINRAAATVMASGAVTILSMPAAAAEPAPASPALEVICDTLGPDTFVFAKSDADRARDAEVGWIDLTTREPGTGAFVSHQRVYERRPNLAVDEICSFEVDGAGATQTVTLGLLLGGPESLTGSDARDAWRP